MMRKNGYEPEIIPADIDETLPFDMSPEAATMYLAYSKAVCAAEKADQPTDAIVIAADTVVVYDKTIIGKPVSRDEAFHILHRLKNSSHDVITWHMYHRQRQKHQRVLLLRYKGVFRGFQ